MMTSKNVEGTAMLILHLFVKAEENYLSQDSRLSWRVNLGNTRIRNRSDSHSAAIFDSVLRLLI
jgi:hypothetical protein